MFLSHEPAMHSQMRGKIMKMKDAGCTGYCIITRCGNVPMVTCP